MLATGWLRGGSKCPSSLSLEATPSNCGKVLKALLPSGRGNTSVARVMSSGMVTTQSMSSYGRNG